MVSKKLLVSAIFIMAITIAITVIVPMTIEQAMYFIIASVMYGVSGLIIGAFIAYLLGK